MGKKWRTNKNSNRKHKRSKTKRMRGGGLFERKVTNEDIVRYLIKQTPPKPIDVQFIVPSKSRLPSMLSSKTNDAIDKSVIFDVLEENKKGQLHYASGTDPLFFVIESNILRVTKENIGEFSNLGNYTIKFVSDITKEVREDMINTEKNEKIQKEQDAQAEQEKKRKLEEDKANTPKIIKVNLLDATKKGILSGLITKTWKTKYDYYNSLTSGDDKFTKIPLSKKEDNSWNFDFFLRCAVYKRDTDKLDDKQKLILKQVIESDLTTTPLTYTDETSAVITFSNPGLIYMAIPGKPETYGGCIIYDIDGKFSNHVQLHTRAEDANIKYFDGDTQKEAQPSVIMEEHLQKLFPQFKPDVPESVEEDKPVAEGETAVEEEDKPVAETAAEEGKPVEETAAEESKPVEETAAEEGETAVEEGETSPVSETPLAEPSGQNESLEENGLTDETVSPEEENKPLSKDVTVEPESETTSNETERDISPKVQDSQPIKQNTLNKKNIPVSSKKNVSPTKKIEEPVEVEEVKLEIEEEEGETDENSKENVNQIFEPKKQPLKQPSKQLDPKINDDLNKLLKDILEFI